MHCPACGSEVPAGSRFCASCGHRLESREDERRVVSVVFGDIVGFTGLSESLDPEQVKNLVDEVFDSLREVIVGFGGRVDKVVGDGIVALFGAPRAHEDDAERAVRAALRMQEAIQGHDDATEAAIRMRIGVNTGEVLVGGFRADDDYTAMGDVVNTASRLQEFAEAGSVVVGQATYEATRGAVRYEALGSVEARGRGEPVRAWKAIEPIGLPGHHRVRVETALVGRAREMRTVVGAIDAAFEQRRSTLVLISGDAGVGKTRLCDEAIAAVMGTRSINVLAGRSVPYGEANVWWPFADAVMSSMGLDLDSDGAEVHVAAVAALAASSGLASDDPAVERAANGLLHLVGHAGPLAGIDPQRANAEAGRALRVHLQGLADRGPVILWLDDLHWADTVVLAMVDALLDRVGRRPFVIVGTTRFDLFDRWSPASGRHTVLSLGLDPLSRDDAARLADDLAGRQLRADVLDEVLGRAGGNPFVLEELVALVGDETDAAIDASELPSTVQGLVAARLDHLSAEESRVLGDAAVLGRSGTVASLERTASVMRGRSDISEALRGLVGQDLLMLSEGQWSFRSELVREVAYERLTKADRARRHAGVAAYLEEHVGPRAIARIADSYRRAAELSLQLGGVTGVPDDIVDRAVGSIAQAVERATGDEAHAVSLVLLEQALGLLAEGDRRRVALLLDRVGVLVGRRDRDGALRDLDEATALLGPPDGLDDDLGERALIDLRRGELESWSSDPAAALPLLASAADAYERAGDERGVAETRRLQGMTNLFLGRHQDADACFTAAHRGFEAIGDRRGAAWTMQNLAWVSYTQGRIEESEERIDRSLLLFDDLGDAGGTAWGRGLLAYLRMHQGRFDDAEAIAGEMLVEAAERGDRWGEGMMGVLLAMVRLWVGEPVEAVARARAAVALFDALDDSLGATQGRAVLGRALVRCGQLDEGFQMLADAARRSPSGGGTGTMGVVAAAAAHVGIGEPEAALEALAGTDDRDIDLIGETDRRVARGLALLQLGRQAEADAVLGDLGDDIGANALAARALADAVRGDRPGLDRTIALASTTTRSTYLDRARMWLASALLEGRERDLEAASSALDTASAEVPTADRVGTLALALARSAILAACDAPADQRRDADRAVADLITELGRDAPGWRNLFASALAAEDQLGALV